MKIQWINGVLLILLILIINSVFSCKSLPKEKLKQSKISLNYEVENDTIRFQFSNPLRCKLRVFAESKSRNLNEAMSKDFPIVLAPQFDTSYSYYTPYSRDELEIKLSAVFGDTSDIIRNEHFGFPFPKGRKYKIIQGYNGSFSHQTDYSRYAIDFSHAVGDTICAAADGYVIGVIEGYKYGGKRYKWREYANFITIYHPSSNLYSQYVHLDHLGSFVEVGDSVKMFQPIGISGNTGYTSIPHLHFNVLKPKGEGMVSTPINFLNGVEGSDLKKGVFVSRPWNFSSDQGTNPD